MQLIWFRDWLKRHLRRHEALDLPEPEENPELYEAWASELARYRIGEEAAEEASRKLVSRRTTARNHFAELVKLACDKPPTLAVVRPPDEEPDWSEPEKLTSEQRRARITQIRRDLPTIEHTADIFPTNPWYARAAAAARAELAKLLETENADRRTAGAAY